jgi:hypothetical protein
MSDYNGHVPADMIEPVPHSEPIAVAGETEELEYQPEPLQIYVHGTFIGGDPNGTRLRDVSVTIPVQPGDTFADYAVAIEAAVREIGHLGYLPGYQTQAIVTGTEPTWQAP